MSITKHGLTIKIFSFGPLKIVVSIPGLGPLGQDLIQQHKVQIHGIMEVRAVPGRLQGTMANTVPL